MTVPRFRRRKADRPQELVEAALDVFLERGYAAARLEDVARRAGVSKGTVYLYFRDKAGLLAAVVESNVVPEIARIETLAADRSLGAGEALARLVANWARIARDTRLAELPKLVIAEAGNFPAFARLYLRRVIVPAHRAVEAIIRRGVAAGEFRAVDPRVVARLAISPLIFAALWRHSLEPFEAKPIKMPALIEGHLDMLLHGLAGRA